MELLDLHSDYSFRKKKTRPLSTTPPSSVSILLLCQNMACFLLLLVSALAGLLTVWGMRESNCRFEEKFQLCNGVFDYCGVWICPEISTKATTSPSPKLVRYRNFMKGRTTGVRKNRLRKPDPSSSPTPPPQPSARLGTNLPPPVPHDSTTAKTKRTDPPPLSFALTRSPSPTSLSSISPADKKGITEKQTSFYTATHPPPLPRPHYEKDTVSSSSASNEPDAFHELSHSPSPRWGQKRRPEIVSIFANGRQIFPRAQEEEVIPRLEIVAKVEYPSKLRDNTAASKTLKKVRRSDIVTKNEGALKVGTIAISERTKVSAPISSSSLPMVRAASGPPSPEEAPANTTAAPATSHAAEAATDPLRRLPSATAEEGEGLAEKLRCS